MNAICCIIKLNNFSEQLLENNTNFTRQIKLIQVGKSCALKYKLFATLRSRNQQQSNDLVKASKNLVQKRSLRKSLLSQKLQKKRLLCSMRKATSNHVNMYRIQCFKQNIQVVNFIHWIKTIIKNFFTILLLHLWR